MSGSACECGHPPECHFPRGARCYGLCAAACQAYRAPPPTDADSRPPPTEAETLLLDCFSVACYRAGLYDHGCIGTYRDAQIYLVTRGLIEPAQCTRRAR